MEKEIDFKNCASTVTVTPVGDTAPFDPVVRGHYDTLRLGGLAFSNPGTNQVMVHASNEYSLVLLFDLHTEEFCEVDFPFSRNPNQGFELGFSYVLGNAVLFSEISMTRGELFVCNFEKKKEGAINRLVLSEKKHLCLLGGPNPRCKDGTVLCSRKSSLTLLRISGSDIQQSESRSFKPMLDACFHPKHQNEFLVCSKLGIGSGDQEILVHKGFSTENPLFKLHAQWAYFLDAKGDTIVMEFNEGSRSYHQIHNPALEEPLKLFFAGSSDGGSCYSVESVSPDGNLVLGTEQNEDEMSVLLIRFGAGEPEFLRIITPGWRVEYVYSIDNDGRIFALATCIDKRSEFFRLSIPVFIEVR